NKIDFNAAYGSASVPEKGRPAMMNGTEFATFMQGFFEDKIKYENYQGGIPDDYKNPSEHGEGTNWYDVLLRTAPTQHYNVTITNATERSATRAVIGYFNQEGAVVNTGYQRFSARLNNETKFGDRVTFGLNVAP